MTSQEEELSLPPIQREVLIGILLGDGSLQTESKGKTYRLRITQSEEHNEYLLHLYHIFKKFTTSPPIKHMYQDKRDPSKTYMSWSFATTQQGCFSFYGQQFYGPDGVKKVPKIIGELLQPRSIAYWYMDDGAQKWKGKSKGVRFCTDGFLTSDVQILADLLRKEYNLETNLESKGKNKRVYVSAKSYNLLKELIWEFFIPSMYYKFPE